MASASKPTGVHYSLIISVIVNLGLLVAAIVVHRNSNELRATNASLQQKESAAKTAEETKHRELELLKKVVGAEFPEIGTPDTDNVNTVVGQIKALINNFGSGSPQATLNDTIVKLAENLRNMTAARDDLQKQLATERATFQQKMDELNAMLAAEKAGRQEADTSKVTADNIHQEELKKKEDDIADLRTKIAQTQAELDEVKSATDVTIKQLTTRVQNLLAMNRKIGDELEEKTRTSFEVADGSILWVDSDLRRVYLDLGEVDGLRPRMTFSVYKKDHAGVGRAATSSAKGPEDIKGAIEVTRIMGPHQAEARILREVAAQPIVKGDPIYSPLWSAGRGETFTLVGIMDLDGDGKSDREQLHEIIEAHGGHVDNEVDDNGNLFVNGKQAEKAADARLTEKTKFVVKGIIPEVTDTSDTDEQAVIEKINTAQKEIDEQARERGIRVVSLSDFLSFIGFKPQRRLYVPGDAAPYTLKNAGRKPATPGTAGTVSGGETSGLYSRDKKLPVKSFRGGATAGPQRGGK